MSNKFQFTQTTTLKPKKFIFESIIKRGDLISSMKPFDLRIKCECAMCYDEFTGKKLLNEEKILDSVHPTSMI